MNPVLLLIVILALAMLYLCLISLFKPIAKLYYKIKTKFTKAIDTFDDETDKGEDNNNENR